MDTKRKLIDLNDVFPNGMMPVITGDPWMTFKKLVDRINNAPIIDAVEVVHGRWILLAEFANRTVCTQCSVCGEEYTYKTGKIEPLDVSYAKYNYCPNCGAKMDGDKDGE